MTVEIAAHYAQIAFDAHTIGQCGGSAAEYEERVTRQLATGARMLAVLAAPRSYNPAAHHRLREMYARSASYAYFELNRRRRDLVTPREFEIAYGLGFDEGERVYSTPETAKNPSTDTLDPTAVQTGLVLAANLLIGRGHIESGCLVRWVARRLGHANALKD